MTGDLPADMAPIAQLIDAQSPEMQALFQYAVVMLVIQDGKAKIIEEQFRLREVLALSSR